MHFLGALWLLVGLLPGLGWAMSTANMGIWNVDSSCYYYPNGEPGGTDERHYLQEGFNEALALYEKGLEDFTFVLDKRPRDSTGYTKWNRIADSIQATLGWHPRHDEKEDPSASPWKHIFGFLNLAIKTLQSNKNSPPKGYNSDLYGISDPRTMIVCGEDTFKWISLNNWVPLKNIKLKDLSSFKDNIKKGATGGWYLQERLIPSKTNQKPVIPRGPDIVGGIDYVSNTFFIFKSMFSTEQKQKLMLTQIKQRKVVQEGQHLSTYVYNLGTLVTHELAHWFSGYVKHHGQVKGGRPVITDVQAVDEYGHLLYQRRDNNEIVSYIKPPSQEMIEKHKLVKITAYGPHFVFNLAVSHPGTDQQSNSGPLMAMQNADSWAMLLTMLYLDDWFWGLGGEARHPGLY